MSIPKPRKDSVEPVTASPSSPSKLFTPVVASLDQVRNHKITLLFKAIEQGDIPLVFNIYLFIYQRYVWNFLWNMSFWYHFAFHGPFYFTRWCFTWNGTTLAQRVVLPPQRLWVTRSCVTPCVSAQSVHPYSRSDLKKTHIFHNSHLHIAYYM